MVHSYSGYRAEERPICFQLAGEKVLVADILGRWIEGGAGVGEGRRSCFKVRGDDGMIYTLCCNLEEGNWSLRQAP
ncbi:hypothetical protein ACFL0G_06035 [Candidatus Zixiibacteriota bacterium]